MPDCCFPLNTARPLAERLDVPPGDAAARRWILPHLAALLEAGYIRREPDTSEDGDHVGTLSKMAALTALPTAVSDFTPGVYLTFRGFRPIEAA